MLHRTVSANMGELARLGKSARLISSPATTCLSFPLAPGGHPRQASVRRSTFKLSPCIEVTLPDTTRRRRRACGASQRRRQRAAKTSLGCVGISMLCSDERLGREQRTFGWVRPGHNQGPLRIDSLVPTCFSLQLPLCKCGRHDVKTWLPDVSTTSYCRDDRSVDLTSSALAWPGLAWCLRVGGTFTGSEVNTVDETLIMVCIVCYLFIYLLTRTGVACRQGGGW